MEGNFDIPYRCPRCGSTKTFSTLPELKAHWTSDHAYTVQKRQRLRIFDYTPQHVTPSSGRRSPLLQSLLDEGRKLEEAVKEAKKQELNNKLQRQKQRPYHPTTSKTSSLDSSSPEKVKKSPEKSKVNFHSRSLHQETDAYLQDTVNQLNQDVLAQRQQQWQATDALYSTQDVLSGIEEAAESRVSEQTDLISQLMQELAEKEQQLLKLRIELERVKDKDKDGNGSENRNSLDSTLSKRQVIEDELVKKKQELKQLSSAKRSDNKRQQQLLNGRHSEPLPELEKNKERAEANETKRVSNKNDADVTSSLNSDGSSLASVTVSRSSSMSNKDRDNQSKQRQQHSSSDARPCNIPLSHGHHHIHNKLQQDDHKQPTNADTFWSQTLNDERKQVVQEMKDLLSKATTDNEKLKDELVAKENLLQFLNQELERSKTDQKELMQETFDLYKEAHKNLNELKERLKGKESQLEQASGRLEAIRKEQEKLFAEKEAAVRNFDDKDLLYQNMMKDREEQIQTLSDLLKSQEEEREMLKAMAGELRQEVEDKEQMQHQLNQAIVMKELELAKAKDDIDILSKFLQTAAAKESVARHKLEAFVTKLIDRADRAEKELKYLRGLNNDSHGNLTADSVMQSCQHHAQSVMDSSQLQEQPLPSMHIYPSSSQQMPWQQVQQLSSLQLPSQQHIQPPSSQQHIQPPSSQQHIQLPPSQQQHVQPSPSKQDVQLSPSKNVQQPSSQQYIHSPPSQERVQQPSSQQHVHSPSSQQHVHSPFSQQYVRPLPSLPAEQLSTGQKSAQQLFSLPLEDPAKEDLSDSSHSYHDTPHFTKAVVDRRPRHREKMKSSGVRRNKYPGKHSRYFNDLSMDGPELSVDENGIMWEAVETFTDASESYRISPYDSETVGDVDTSVLSSHSRGRKRGRNGGGDTDDDVDSLVDESILLLSEERDSISLRRSSPERKLSELPLGERITRVLKTVGRDEDSECLDLLIKQNGDRNKKNSEVNRNATSVYGTHERVPRHSRESPLERALAVQKRVKSLTYPRSQDKSLIASDAEAVLVSRPPSAHSDGNHFRPAARTRRVTSPNKSHHVLADQGSLGLEQLEEFSSSSYAAIPPASKTVGTTEKCPAKLTKNRVAVTKNTLLKLQSQNDTNGVATVDLQHKMQGSSTDDRNIKAISSKSRQEFKVSDLSYSESLSADDARELPQSHDSGEKEMVLDAEKHNQSQNRMEVNHNRTLKQAPVFDPAVEPTSSSKERNLNGHVAVRQSSISGNPLVRQISVSIDESELKRLAMAPLKPARQLRARFAQSYSESSVQSSDTENVSKSPPVTNARSQSPQGKGGDDSTDFDLESDLEKFSAHYSDKVGEIRMGVLAGKTCGRKSALKMQKVKKNPGGRQNQRHFTPDVLEVNSSTISDVEVATKSQRHEEKRRRRVALFHVFSYLDTRFLCKMALVCKEWHRVSRHPALWKHVHLKYERISSQFLVTLAKWCTQLTSLTLEVFDCCNFKPRFSIARYMHMVMAASLRPGSRQASETMDEYHRRTRACLEPGLEEMLKASQDSLISLSIIACGNVLTDKCMWLVSGYCRLMKQLTYLSDTHPPTAEVMWALGGGCPSITSLIIPPLFPCHNSEGMNNRCLMLIAQFYPDLLEVGVGGRSLDIAGLVPLVQSCQRLQLLNLDHIKEMGDDSATALCRAGLKQLQRLELSGTSVTANALQTFYNSCRHIKEIRVFVSIGDYFEDIRKKKNKEEYKKAVHSLEELRSQPGLGNILQLRAAPVE